MYEMICKLEAVTVECWSIIGILHCEMQVMVIYINCSMFLTPMVVMVRKIWVTVIYILTCGFCYLCYGSVCNICILFVIRAATLYFQKIVFLLTCLFVKLVTVVDQSDHVMEHFKINKLFSNNQYGFIKCRSTLWVKKTCHCTFVWKFAKCWPIFKILSLTDSLVNLQ